MSESVKRVFVDTANGAKPHRCYDPDGEEFFEVRRLRDLKDYGEVYIDSSLFPGMWADLRILVIDRGVRVFYFAWPWMWREFRQIFKDQLRERFGKIKTDYGDAWILYKIYAGFEDISKMVWLPSKQPFQEITWIDVEMKPLLMKEKIFSQGLRRLRQYESQGIDMGAGMDLFEKRFEEARREIIAKAKEIWPRFMKVAAKLGLDEDDLGGLTGLAGTLTYLGWPLRKPSMHKLRRYFGLYRPSKEDKLKFMERAGKKFHKRYSGSARRYLNMLTKAILAKEGRCLPKARDEKDVLKKLIEALKGLEPVEGLGGAKAAQPRVLSIFAPMSS